MGLQLPAGLPCLRGAGAAGVCGGSARQPLLATAHTPAECCVLPPPPLSLWSFLQRATLPRLSPAGRAWPLPRAGGGGGGALGSGSNCQHSPASATSKHRKQVGLVDPTPHKGSPHLEGGSIQTRKATSSGSLVGSHLPSLACHEVGSSGCQEQERWHCKDEIWVI